MRWTRPGPGSSPSPTSPSITIVTSQPRRIAPADLPTLAALNDAAVPAVSPLGLAGLTAHVPRCEVAVVIDDDDGVPVAFLLGLVPGASPDELKQAYRKRVLETHPDQGGDAERFQEVQRAYDKLKLRLDARSKRRK